MKKSLIIPLLFLFACHSREDKVNVLFDKSINQCNDYVRISNDHLYIDAEVYNMKKPIKNKENKIIVDRIEQISDSILSMIEKSKAELIIKKNSLYKKTNCIAELSHCLFENKQLLEKYFTNDILLKKKIKTKLFFNKTELDNFTALEFNLLISKIRNLNFCTLQYLTKIMETPRNSFNTLEVLIVPKKYYLFPDESYKANIYLASIDTSCNFTIKVDKKIIKSSEGKANYIAPDSDSSKIVNKFCKLETISVYLGDTLTFPFQLKYEFKTK